MSGAKGGAGGGANGGASDFGAGGGASGGAADFGAGGGAGKPASSGQDAARERPTRVLVVDDHPLFRMGLSMALSAEGFTVAGEAENGKQALERARRGDVDVVLLDVRMPEMDGIEVCRGLTGGNNAPAVVMLTTYEEPGVIRAARQAGAKAFLSKETAPRELARLLRAILANPQRDWMPQVALPSFTPREEQVLKLLNLGLSNKDIARRMDLSPDTVKDHLERVFQKLEVRDRLSAVKRATELGLV